MKKLMLLALFTLLCTTVYAQQINVTFAWDASESAATQTPSNPVKYRLCLSPVAPPYSPLPETRTIVDTGTALEGVLPISRGITYVFATAYWCGLMSDGVCQDPVGTVSESGPSNVLKLEVTIPPGNPRNYRIRSSVVAKTQSGQTIRQWARID